MASLTDAGLGVADHPGLAGERADGGGMLRRILVPVGTAARAAEAVALAAQASRAADEVMRRSSCPVLVVRAGLR